MKNIIHIAFLFIFVLGLSAYEIGDFTSDLVFKPLQFSFPSIQKETSLDGTEILSLTENDFPIVSAEFHIYYGRKNLGNRKVEIIRLLEDSWEFSGSKNYPKDLFLQEFEKLGAAFSLSVGYEKTIIEVSYLKKDEKRIAELLSSFWNEPNLDSDVIATMRSRISDEIKRRNDSPTSVGKRKIRERVLANSILGRVATLEALDSVTIEELTQFQSEIFSEKKRKLLLTGDADPIVWKEQIKLLPTKQISQIRAEEIQNDLIDKNLSAIKGQHILVEKDVSQAFVTMMGSCPKHNDPDFFAVKVLNYIIGGGGFNAYFMREIRNNRGLAYSAGSDADFQKGYGLIFFFAATKVESTAEVLKLMQELIQKDFISGLKEDEIKRAQVAIVNQFVFEFEDNKKVLRNELRFQEHDMPRDHLVNFRQNIEKVTLEDIKRVGAKYFNPDSLSILVVGPKKLKESLGSNFKIIQPEENSF